MAGVISFNQENHLTGIVSKDRKEYCQALEVSGVYGACKENIRGLLDLLDPFFDFLNKKFWLDGNGMTSSYPPKNDSEKKLYKGLSKIGAVSQSGPSFSLTEKGYNLITLYRKRKNLPTREADRKKSIDKLINHSRKLNW